MYDLPGGGIEEGETIEEGLHREFMEEVECTLKEANFLGEIEDRFDFVNIKEENIDFHHIGKCYEVALSDNSNIKEDPDGHDSLGAEWVSLQDIHDEKVQVPNIVKKALSLLSST